MLKFAVLCCVLWCGNVDGSRQCLSPHTIAVKLSVVSRRNATGHWIAQASLDHAGDQQETGPYVLDMDHVTTTCEGEESVLLVTTVTAPPRQLKTVSSRQLGPGYELLPGLGYYKFHNTTQTWFQATLICAKEGGRMLVLNSEQEFAALKKIWDKSGVVGEHLHIGINDFDKDLEYITISGEPINTTGYNKWKPGEPNSGTAVDCGAVARSGLLEDSYCSNKFPFFCEQSLNME